MKAVVVARSSGRSSCRSPVMDGNGVDHAVSLIRVSIRVVGVNSFADKRRSGCAIFLDVQQVELARIPRVLGDLLLGCAAAGRNPGALLGQAAERGVGVGGLVAG